MLDELPRRVERLAVVKQPDPQRRKRADPAPAAAIRAAHFEKALEPDFGESGGKVVGPVGQPRFLARQLRQLAIDEGAEAFAGDIDVLAVAEHEIHRHFERVIAVALISEAVLEHEGQHAGAAGVGVFPDMAAEALVAVGLALGERRVGEQRRRHRLQGEADAELLHHVGFGRIIEVHLDGAGTQHHVEAEAANFGHVAEHDRVAALGHDRQIVTALVGPHPGAEET